MNYYGTLHECIWGASPVLLCSYILSLIIIIHNRKTDNKAFRLFVPLTMLGALVIYFPGFDKLALHYMSNYAVVRRLRWILLIVPILSVGLTLLMEHCDKKRKLLVGVVIVALMMMLFPQPQIKTWTKELNHYYKIPEECIEIGNYIYEQNEQVFEADKLAYVTVVIQDEEPTDGSAEDGNRRIGWGIRQYISPTALSFVEISPEEKVSSEYVNCDYAISTKTQSIRNAFGDAGYQLVKEYDTFCFYEKNNAR